MGNEKIRLLRAEEIECRIAAINEQGISILLYKDARVDQRILDETFGLFGWKRSHQCINGNLYCTVEIYDKETGMWISKQDVGAAGFAEKEKSQASDSFKRACFNWGIGRELYSAPFIWVPASNVNIKKRGEKFCCNNRFSVSSIGYNADREISSLTVVNEKGAAVYKLNPKNKGLSTEQMDSLKAELNRTGVEMETVKDRYHIERPEQMSEELYAKVMQALSKTNPVKAA